MTLRDFLQFWVAFWVGLLIVILIMGCGDDLISSESETSPPETPIISLKEIRVEEFWYPTQRPETNSQRIVFWFSLEAAEPLPYSIAVDVLISGTRVWGGSQTRWSEDEGTIFIRRRGDEVEFKIIRPTWWWKGDGQVKEWKHPETDYSVKSLTVQILTWDKTAQSTATGCYSKDRSIGGAETILTKSARHGFAHGTLPSLRSFSDEYA